VERGTGGGAAVENGLCGSYCGGRSTGDGADGEARVQQRIGREKIGTRAIDLSGGKNRRPASRLRKISRPMKFPYHNSNSKGKLPPWMPPRELSLQNTTIVGKVLASLRI
jgi:hypothetical protein